MSETAVEFKQVSKDYGAGFVLNNFNLTVPKEQIVTIIGPSGCGKTTILKMINRLIEPEAGQILLEGSDIGELDPVLLRRNIGYVIQQIGLFPHMTIEENITVVPRLKGEPKRQLKERTEELLSLIGLEPEAYRKRYPHELSGGQQQRIGVARALAANPSIVLMDEPFSALDPISRIQLQKELIKLNEHVKKTIVFVTHDIDEALKIADQIVLLKDGKVVQAGTPEELLNHPANDFVKEFIGQERFKTLVPQHTVSSALAHHFSVYGYSKPADALQYAKTHELDTLPVTCEQNKYLGIIGRDQLQGEQLGDGERTVSEIMRTDAPFVRGDAPIAQLFELLKKNHIVPVVDASHKLIGAVTQGSLLEAISKQFNREEVLA
ncbi:betaine/proline/choline family ABC transporter ATP-binding protein [Paenibacillus sinopodophylli]|uniref:betaine/proline/choline family ABC transporter ATP-binding protein n=1 Tax=Paenibacillus sinopodophylli TaxID=1837342 RepID=UPI00110CF8D7|nr:betaine/proline/choline family ABC transporter ATP-binding protein [Paenibacillus sinopodophylli]